MKHIYMAVDLGTTMIDSCIMDAENGDIISRRSMKNPQRLYGSDVINRILTVKRDIAFLVTLREQAVLALRQSLLEMLSDREKCVAHTPEEHENVRLDGISIAGNTTMISILLGLDVSDMGEAPFPTALHESVILSYNELFSEEDIASFAEDYPELFSEDCTVYLTGCSSAFLGGDVLSGVLYLEKCMLSQVPKRYLFLDLGTNGEMVLKDNDRYFATSTACGPAFEGCARKQHAYGNSLLEAIALGRRLEKIDANGALSDEYLESGIVIHGIQITSEILQAIMLAKAAVYAGIICLIRAAGLSVSDIEQVYIAGGFGFYMNPQDAVSLGMLPREFLSRIVVVGNTSLLGAERLLTDEKASIQFEDYRTKLHVLNLANTEGFQDCLMDACNFSG
ncbi:MAG: ASKHA domain-containing protein [Wujia sp.]